MSALGNSTPHRPTGATRTAVLATVRRSEQPITVHEIAAELGLHTNSVRFHLSRLLRAGLLHEGQHNPDGPGRPHLVYTAVPTPPAEPAESEGRAAPGAPGAVAPAPTPLPVQASSPTPADAAGSGDPGGPGPMAGVPMGGGYPFLAEMLAGHLAATSPDPQATACSVGEAWGHYLADRPVPFSRTTEEESVERMTEILDRIGFSPASRTEDPNCTADGQELNLRTCPFRTVADHRPSVVCSVHLGLMRGALAEMDAPVEVERLDRFDTPYPCIVRLRAVGGGSTGIPADASGDGKDTGADDHVQDLPGWSGRVAG